MANRFPLVIDTTDGNKLKELPAGDNLDLRESSIVRVQDIDAVGTINAADITINGNRLEAQNFIDLTDTPANYVDAANKFLKVNATGDAIEFRDFNDIGNISVDEIEVAEQIVPATVGDVDIGTTDLYFNRVVANEFMGDLIAGNESRVFNAATGKISYAALEGAPTQVSEFENDIGYLLAADLDSSLAGLFDEGATFDTDIRGSVFGDDSSMIIDGVASEVVGVINNTTITTVNLTASIADVTTARAGEYVGPADNNTIINARNNYDVVIGEENTGNTVIYNGEADGFTFESGTGIAEYSASTDLIFRAGNRIRFADTPVRFSQLTDTEAGYLVGQNGDVIYNTTQNRFQLYQNSAWVELHKGQFDGNVVTVTGTSEFNDVEIAGNLTVSGTTTTVDTTNTTISDNVIVLNNGETGAGVTGTTSGIEIDRGSEANVTFVYNDSTDKWTIGTEAFEASDISSSDNGSITDFASITGAGSGDLTQFVNITGTGAGTLSSFLNITGASGGTISGFTTLTGDSGGTISGFLNLTGDSGGTISGFTTLTGDSGGTISGFTTLTGDSGGTISGFLNLAGDTGGTISGFTTITGDTGGDITGFTNITGDTGGTISGFTNITGDFGGILTGFSIVGDLTGDVYAADGIAKVLENGTDGSDATFTGNVTGNIDNTTLTLGGTSATAITIGNSGSTTTVEGTIQFTNALIANNLTADDSISITTDVGDGNAISIGPGGTNTFINFTADNIRFFGPVTSGITGDLKGSVFGDDSGVIVDAVNGTLNGNLTGNVTGNVVGDLTGTADIATSITAVANNTTDETVYIAFLGGATGTQGIETDTALTYNPSSNVLTAGGFVGNITGTVTGDLQGSVFGDDSSLLVDAVNGTIPGYISIATLQSIVAGAATYGDFQTAVAAL